MKTKITVALLCGTLTAAVGCENGPPGTDSDDAGSTQTQSAEGSTQPETETEAEAETETETGAQPVGTFEVGFGEDAFAPLVDGGELHIVWGSQGSAMFPMPIRGSAFELAPDPTDYTDPRTPILDLELDIEGMDPGVCGNFKCIRNYPITFDVLPDQTYEFVYVRVIMPDDVDPTTLDGRAAHLEVTLSPHNSAPHVEIFELTVAVDPPPI